ncbi:MAG: translation initiation factor IF-3 [Deltaproteobacteria bacterium]|nr:translation initiation factor IF-3 [Deltaproteobacteria bacterium]
MEKPFRRDELRVNRRIRVPEVRLIGHDGTQFGVLATFEALRRAEEVGLDLVEIAPTARPPVCKVMDYGKYKYEQSKKKHEAKRHQVVVKIKEIKMRPATDEHDFQIKLKQILKFLEHGDKVRVTLRFRGREMAHNEIGQARMKRVMTDVAGKGEVEQMPKMEGKQLFMMLAPAKKH